jgi:hypothetical protein
VLPRSKDSPRKQDLDWVHSLKKTPGDGHMLQLEGSWDGDCIRTAVLLYCFSIMMHIAGGGGDVQGSVILVIASYLVALAASFRSAI